MKYLLMSLLVGLCGYAYAPEQTEHWVRLDARVTAYSPYQRNEKKVNHLGRSIRNENGLACSNRKYIGKEIFIEGIGIRIGDDIVPRKSANKHFRRHPEIDTVFDLRFYDSLNRKKSINKQLYKRDKGVKEVWVRID